MEDSSFGNNSESLFHETSQETTTLLAKLTSDNEEYQQTIHVLRRELDTTKAMFQEMKDTWEENSAQQSQRLDIATQKLTEKFNEERKVFQSRIKELEENLLSKVDENQILISENYDLKKQEKLPTIQEETICEEKTEPNDSKLKEIMIILEEKENNEVQLQKCKSNLEDQITDLQSIIQDLKNRMEEKNQIIENIQEELINCRLELNTLKTAPANDHQKGNSLFAEVEDRRQHMMEKMQSMRASYLEMQRSFKAKESEIKNLKLERATLLRQYEETAIESVEQEETLIDAYTTRIRDLENRLKYEQKKLKELQKEQQTTCDMNYLQTVLKSKKKEIEELQLQIENNSIRTLLKEEFSYKLKSRLRYWKYKALSLEANLAMVEDQLQANPNYSSTEIQELLKNQMSNKSLKVDNEFEDEPEPSFKPEIVDETRFSLENLIQPKPLFQQTLDTTLTEMSLSTVANDSCLDSEVTVLADCNTKIPSNICKKLNFTNDMSITGAIGTSSSIIDLDATVLADPTAESSSKMSKTLNFTQDMSMTQPIATSSFDCSLKVEIDENMEDFQPASTSSCLDNVQLDQVSLKNREFNKENVSTAGNSTILKSALSKSMKYPDEPKEKKVLRFTQDTVDPQGSYIRKLKAKQLNYPIVYISSDPKK